jgi:septal ring factor EnvC (AmiA/AmiB activator)
MTVERWDDDRLDRLASMVESNARVIQALANTAAEASEERQQILQVIAQQQERIAQQQEEIRGLQTENRRILDILLNDRDRPDNPTN